MNHTKKMIAPIIITALIVFYYGGIALLFMLISGIPFGIKALLVVVPLVISAIMIGVLVSRMKEITGGEEDDLSKY